MCWTDRVYVALIFIGMVIGVWGAVWQFALVTSKAIAAMSERVTANAATIDTNSDDIRETQKDIKQILRGK